RPDFLAVLLRKSPDDLVPTTMAHSVDSPGGHGRHAVATAKAFDLPGERRAVLWPFLEQTGLFGMGRAVRSLPLRPIKLSAESVLGESGNSKSECGGSIHMIRIVSHESAVT